MSKEKTLADPDEALVFAQDLMRGVRQAVNETKSFSSMAFLIATMDPQSKTQYDSPKAVPISLELVFEVLGEVRGAEVLAAYEDPQVLFEQIVKVAAEQAKAIGVVLITSGTAKEVTIDPETQQPTGEEESREAILMVLQHIRCATVAWIATVHVEGEELVSMDEFQQIHTTENTGLAKAILPLWN